VPSADNLLSLADDRIFNDGMNIEKSDVKFCNFVWQWWLNGAML